MQPIAAFTVFLLSSLRDNWCHLLRALVQCMHTLLMSFLLSHAESCAERAGPEPTSTDINMDMHLRTLRSSLLLPCAVGARGAPSTESGSKRPKRRHKKGHAAAVAEEEDSDEDVDAADAQHKQQRSEYPAASLFSSFADCAQQQEGPRQHNPAAAAGGTQLTTVEVSCSTGAATEQGYPATGLQQQDLHQHNPATAAGGAQLTTAELSCSAPAGLDSETGLLEFLRRNAALPTGTAAASAPAADVAGHNSVKLSAAATPAGSSCDDNMIAGNCSSSLLQDPPLSRTGRSSAAAVAAASSCLAKRSAPGSLEQQAQQKRQLPAAALTHLSTDLPQAADPLLDRDIFDDIYDSWYKSPYQQHNDKDGEDAAADSLSGDYWSAIAFKARLFQDRTLAASSVIWAC
jgi:hypothetical protein